MKKLLVFALAMLMLATTLVSCKKEVIVTLDGGTIDQNYLEKADFDDVIASVPTREGYVFAGWYSDATYTDYINPKLITDEQRDAGRAFAKWITVPESKVYGVRTEEISITDTGRANQKMDKVGIMNDFNVTDLIRAGYTSLTVKVNFSACEIDDGYQYVFVYKNEQCVKPATSSLIGIVDKYILGEEEEDPSLLHTYQFDHGASAVNAEWAAYEFETTVSLNALEKDLYLRYGASGNAADTWKNKDIVVTVSANK